MKVEGCWTYLAIHRDGNLVDVLLNYALASLHSIARTAGSQVVTLEAEFGKV